MLRIKDTIFSLDVIEKKFECDLPACRGYCCRYGDSGAPLTDDEVKMLDQSWPVIKPYLRSEGIRVIRKKGTSTTDFENERVTPLIGNNEECAYTVFDDNIYKCGIEKAWSDGKISFRKPLSCHLFPVRIKRYRDFTAVNYQQLSICIPGRECGESGGVYLYEFLREALVRALGVEIYEDLCIAALELRRPRSTNN